MRTHLIPEKEPFAFEVDEFFFKGKAHISLLAGISYHPSSFKRAVCLHWFMGFNIGFLAAAALFGESWSFLEVESGWRKWITG